MELLKPNNAGEVAPNKATKLGKIGEQHNNAGNTLPRNPPVAEVFRIFPPFLNEYTVNGIINAIKEAIIKEKIINFTVNNLIEINPIRPPVYVAGKVNKYNKRKAAKLIIPSAIYFLDKKTIFPACFIGLIIFIMFEQNL